MTYVLSNADVLPVAVSSKTVARKTTADASAARAPSIWRRALDGIVASRTRSAERALRERNFLINEAEMVLGGFPAATLSNDVSLPFNR